jgi:hypothetical protein
MNPETSHRENPIKAHLINTSKRIELRDEERIKDEKIVPTPIATPPNEIMGNAAATYLKPNKSK